MATRTHARQMVVELLYAYTMGNERIFDFADELLSAKKIRNAQADFAKSLFSGVVAHLAQIDSIINANLKSWELSRLGAIDKCILRLGVYEILKGEIDAPVAINEAIEIAKILGAERTGGFVNGVLDAVRKGDFDLEKGVESAIDSSESSVDSDSTKKGDFVKNRKDSTPKRDFVRNRKDFATRTGKKRNFTKSAKSAESLQFCHFERSEKSQKNIRDSSIALQSQNDKTNKDSANRKSAKFKTSPSLAEFESTRSPSLAEGARGWVKKSKNPNKNHKDSVAKRDFVRKRKDFATRTSKKRNFTDSARSGDFAENRTDSTKKYKRDSAKKANFTPKNQTKKSYAKKPQKSR